MTCELKVSCRKSKTTFAVCGLAPSGIILILKQYLRVSVMSLMNKLRMRWICGFIVKATFFRDGCKIIVYRWLKCIEVEAHMFRSISFLKIYFMKYMFCFIKMLRPIEYLFEWMQCFSAYLYSFIILLPLDYRPIIVCI
jgi:hypothetical protein